MPSVCVLDPDDPTGRVWECQGLQRRHVNDPTELNVLRFLGAQYLDASTPADARRFWMKSRVPVATGTNGADIAENLLRALPADVARATADELARRLKA